MVERCCSPKNDSYRRYGGRGITVCDEWRNDFQTFCKWARENGYDPDAEWSDCTIDRIDNSKGYSPENCRWIDIKTQQRNKRTNRRLKLGAEERTMVEWSEITGLKLSTISKRLHSGWSIEDTLTKPLMVNKSHSLEKGA